MNPFNKSIIVFDKERRVSLRLTYSMVSMVFVKQFPGEDDKFNRTACEQCQMTSVK